MTTTGAFRLNSQNILEHAKRRGLDNWSQLQRETNTTYTTLHRYMTADLSRIDADVLISILIDGLGLTVKEVEDMRFGDIVRLMTD